MLPPPRSTLFPYTTLFRSLRFAVIQRILWIDTDWNGVVSRAQVMRSEEHTSELQSRENLVCRLLLEKKKTKYGSASRLHTGPGGMSGLLRLWRCSVEFSPS